MALGRTRIRIILALCLVAIALFTFILIRTVMKDDESDEAVKLLDHSAGSNDTLPEAPPDVEAIEAPTTTTEPATSSSAESTSASSSEAASTETEASTETTAAITPSTTAIPTEPVTNSNAVDLSFCSALQNPEKQSCPQRTDSTSANDDWMNPEQESLTASAIVQAFHYKVNLTFERLGASSLEGKVDVFLRTVNDTNFLVLHADRRIFEIDESEIAIWNCFSGDHLCTSSVTRLIDRQLLLISLEEKINAGTALLLRIGRFQTEITGNPGVLLQIPSTWERDRSWTLGSVFQVHGARTVFPSVDEENTRASFELCLKHPEKLDARSNMPAKDAHVAGEECFETTPPISTRQVEFAVFRSVNFLPTPSKPPNETKVEVIVGKHTSPTESMWIAEETETALRRITELTDFPFPSRKLTVMSSSMDLDGTHGLGLIRLKETWVEYPKYLLTHTILVREVVRQWIGNVVTTCDQCLQSGLATYLEWVVSAELPSVNLTARDRFVETKQRILRSGNDNAAGFLIVQDEASGKESECSDRIALVFYLLEQNVGSAALQTFLKSLLTQYAWQKCATIADLSKLVATTTNSTTAEHMLLTYGSTSEIPLLRVQFYDNGTLRISQEGRTESEVGLFTVPVSVVDSTNHTEHFVLSEGHVTANKAASFVIVQPESSAVARAVYNVENYQRLAQCIRDQAACGAATVDTATSVLGDLCWALLEDRLSSPNDDVSKWHGLFGELQSLGVLQGDCDCCTQRRSAAKAQCKWRWRDKCQNLRLALNS